MFILFIFLSLLPLFSWCTKENNNGGPSAFVPPKKSITFKVVTGGVKKRHPLNNNGAVFYFGQRNPNFAALNARLNQRNNNRQ